ncbi:hypothetical protein ACFRCG_39875 [Embleya sp. NPDC056575]|uniref:VG15 protein n=1 Tax=unclassified Embleya TaxID=2699296 RepID=UPI00368939D0
MAPPTPEEITAARAAQSAAIQQAVMQRVQEIWSQMQSARIVLEMSGDAGRAILNAVLAGQLTVAQGAQQFVEACMGATAGATGATGATGAAAAAALAGGPPPAPPLPLVPATFAGTASDGRPLESLLYIPAITVADRRAAGESDEDAMLAGLSQMTRIVSTQIADIAREADEVAMVADNRVVAYVRVVEPPACSRCILLAGRIYKILEAKFARHPNCDCGKRPLKALTDDEYDLATNPDALWEAMSERERVRTFGSRGAQAITEGSDMGQVVNARRGMNTATAYGHRVQTTTEGTTRRGHAYHRMRQVGLINEVNDVMVPGQRVMRTMTPRLMPEEIYRLADGDREHAQRLLYNHGYLAVGPARQAGFLDENYRYVPGSTRGRPPST